MALGLHQLRSLFLRFSSSCLAIPWDPSCPIYSAKGYMTVGSCSTCCSAMSSHLCCRAKGCSRAGKAPAPEWGGSAPVWWSLMRSHNQQPLHALLRGGGQINGDRIFKV